ncbi:MAG TPA: hypothetical protein VLY86_05265 [Methanothrix sp.]|nr:hypothetical protein [Methanothrix sp.]
MDYVVHINNGSEAAKPIVLRLLPGEETIFNLKIVNHGEPSNISLEASDPVIKAVRLKRPDHYVVLEETVPVLARMPTNGKRLDGELLLTSNAGRSRVPITLFRETDDPTDLEYDPEGSGPDSLEDGDLSPERETDEEDQEPEADAFEMDEDEERVEAESEPEDFDDAEHEHIRFTRQRDLHSYKSASRSASGFSSGPRPTNYGTEDEVGIERGFGEEREPRYHQRDLQEGRKYGEENPEYGSGQYASEPGPYHEEEEAESYEDGGGVRGLFGSGGSLQIIPAVILVTLISVLILTFLTESLPEFPGALASSILIVTLIIYGAATLLKA